MDTLQKGYTKKGIYHDPVNMDNRTSEKIQDLKESRKLHHEIYGKLKSRTSFFGEKFSQKLNFKKECKQTNISRQIKLQFLKNAILKI